MSLFTTVISKAPKRNAFDLSFENLFTAEFGQLIPIVCKEVLPGDKFRINTEILVKTAPMLAPVMSRIDAYMYTFFVPNRLLQTDWEEFITTGTDGLSTNLLPVGTKLSALAAQFALGWNGQLPDYMNLPAITPSDISSITGLGDLYINMLNFGAYQKIYSDWFRDELLDSYEFEPVAGGQLNYLKLQEWTRQRFRSWRKDYFTSARPTTQLGQSIGAPISGDIISDGVFRFAQSASQTATRNFARLGSSQEQTSNPSITGDAYAAPIVDANTATVQYYQDGLSLGEAEVSILELRRALRLQEWQERNMRGGNRYIENIFQHFGVKSSDARLQRSQYLGGRKVPIVISEIAQTSSTDSVSPQGNLSGRGSAVGRSKYIKFFAEEHGWLITVFSIMPKAGYMQGLPRHYWRDNYLKYPWPLLANIGEQEVKNGEIFLLQNNFNDGFGYQSQYAEMKSSPNEVHGSFRDSMLFWHNYRLFDSAPNLNNDFVQLNGGQDDSTVQGQNRIFPTLPDGFGHFYVQSWNDIKVVRALPKYGIPTL